MRAEDRQISILNMLPRRSASNLRADLQPDAFIIEKLSFIDDWPERVTVTAAEVDIFERYFGDVLDRLFHPVAAPKVDVPGLHLLTSDGNNKL